MNHGVKLFVQDWDWVLFYLIGMALGYVFGSLQGTLYAKRVLEGVKAELAQLMPDVKFKAFGDEPKSKDTVQ